MLKNLILALISCVLSLLGAEWALRKFAPAPKIISLPTAGRNSAYELSDNPILGYTLKKNFRADDPDCHQTFESTNSFGFRDREWQSSPPNGFKRVLLVGDSVVAGNGICKNSATISANLDHLLVPRQIEVLNFGIGGYCTRGEVELLAERGLQLKPDLVVVVFVENDYVNSNGAIINSLRTPLPPLLQYGFKRSHLVRKSLLATNYRGIRSALDAQSLLSHNKSAVGEDNVGRGFEMLRTLSEQHGFKVLVVLWPQFGDRAILEPVAPGQAPGSDKSLGQELAERYGLRTYQLRPAFTKDFAARQKKQKKRKRPLTPRWTYTTGDGIHANELGARVAASALEIPITEILGSAAQLE